MLPPPLNSTPSVTNTLEYGVDDIITNESIGTSYLSGDPIYEEPVANKVYDDFLYWDHEVQIYDGANSGEFHFLKGIEINTPQGGGTSTAFYLGGNNVFNIGEATGKLYDGVFVGKTESIDVNNDSKLTINASGRDIYFGSNSWDTYGDAATIYVSEGAKFNVVANNLHTSGGAETNLKLFDNAQSTIRLTGDFISEKGGTGIAIQNNSSNSKTRLDIEANNINLSTVEGGAQRLAGLYLLGYGDGGSSDLTVNLTASNKIDITGYERGITTFGSTHASLKANIINISADMDNGRGLNLNGYDADKSTTVELYAQTQLEISGAGYGAYLNDRSTALINAKTLNLTSASGTAVYLYEQSKISSSAEQTKIFGQEYDVRIYSGSALDVNSSIISIGEGKNANDWSIFVTGENSSLILNSNEVEATVFLDGYTKSMNNASISVNAGNGSILSQRAIVENGGIYEISLHGSAAWHAPMDNSISSLKFVNGGHLDFVHQANQDSYGSVTTGTLTSNGKGNLTLRLDFDKDIHEPNLISNDQLIIENSATGLLVGEINFVGNNTNLEDTVHSNNWLISQGEGSNLTIQAPDGGNTYIQSGGLTCWGLKFLSNQLSQVSPDDIDWDSLTNTGMDAGKWYLAKVDAPIEEIPEIVDNITIGTSASQALAYMADLEDLRKRLGEVRYGAQAGAWVKAFAKKDNVSTSGSRGFEQDVYGINVGLDTLIGTSESASWLVGGAFRYARADQEGIGIDATSGDLDEYSIKAYATWMHEKGSYADFVLQAGRYEQKLSGLDNTGSGTSRTDYGTWGFGASVEIGHMFSLADDVDDRRWFNHFFIEPQLELSYFHARGADYSTSTGLKVSQNNADFFTGRAGLVVGKKFSYGSEDELDRRYFQLAVIGGVKHEFLGGDQTIRYTGVDGAQACVHADDIDGTRFYYGLNFDWQVSDSFRLYAQFDREEGDHYTKEYDFSVGAKWSF